MRCLVTGAAGFIGSHLCERLLEDGHDVIGIDALVPYYDPQIKQANLTRLLQHQRFRFYRWDLRYQDLREVVRWADYIFHLAAMPGLIQAWQDFEGYWTCNVLATHRLLEAVQHHASSLRRFLYISTSSVYGRYASGDESLPLKPISPYGVTKLAGEQLCRAHAEVYGLPLVVLRYFSVYGPRQRPDMAYHRFIRALLLDEPITVYGDGLQIRGNTYISDCIEATIRTMDAPPGETYNIGGGETATVWEIIRKLEGISGRKARIRQEASRPGDQRYTFADTTKLRLHFDWRPRVGLDEGLRQQWAWQERQLTKANKSSATRESAYEHFGQN
ncbi:MAG: NAD-dependent epimerase/dehydratase family protein [Gemmatales bacterium]|nr:NAD-dependent epimerase/dehydratase family protein [Gemmatales bacterium]MDW7994976.1 NAD-dependent epimerase/dehydratase family protein [Gemmatales bacterium]